MTHRTEPHEKRVPVLVAFPPLSVARDFIDYPYFADLGAAQLAATSSLWRPPSTRSFW